MSMFFFVWLPFPVKNQKIFGKCKNCRGTGRGSFYMTHHDAGSAGSCLAGFDLRTAPLLQSDYSADSTA
jgi:hypothetical protein